MNVVKLAYISDTEGRLHPIDYFDPSYRLFYINSLNNLPHNNKEAHALVSRGRTVVGYTITPADDIKLGDWIVGMSPDNTPAVTQVQDIITETAPETKYHELDIDRHKIYGRGCPYPDYILTDVGYVEIGKVDSSHALYEFDYSKGEVELGKHSLITVNSKVEIKTEFRRLITTLDNYFVNFNDTVIFFNIKGDQYE